MAEQINKESQKRRGYGALISDLRCCAGKECDKCTVKIMTWGCWGRLLKDAAAAIDGLTDKLFQLEEIKPTEPRNWTSVKERLPDGFAAVIVARHIKKGEPLKVEQGYYLGNSFWKVYGTQTKRVLFWMPFPEPPEEGK